VIILSTLGELSWTRELERSDGLTWKIPAKSAERIGENLLTKTALTILDKWMENPTLDYTEELVSDAVANKLTDVKARTGVREIEGRVLIILDDGKPIEGILTSYSQPTRQHYEIIEEGMLKIVEFKEGLSGTGGFLHPRCNQPIRCRVRNTLVNCLCGHLYNCVKHQKYRYALPEVHA
jgi:hypothetical protein